MFKELFYFLDAIGYRVGMDEHFLGCLFHYAIAQEEFVKGFLENIAVFFVVFF